MPSRKGREGSKKHFLRTFDFFLSDATKGFFWHNKLAPDVPCISIGDSESTAKTKMKKRSEGHDGGLTDPWNTRHGRGSQQNCGVWEKRQRRGGGSVGVCGVFSFVLVLCFFPGGAFTA